MEINYNLFHKYTSVQKKIINKKDFTYRLILEVLDKYIASIATALDIGCGAGTLSLYLGSKGIKVLGVDISINAIRASSSTARYLNLSEYVNFRVIDFPKQYIAGRYNLILLTEVIEHLKKDEYVLKKIKKMLDKNGLLFLSAPSKSAPLYRMGLLKKFDKKVGHLRRYSIDELCNKIERNGFNIIEVKKVEGILRNFLFTNSVAGKGIKFIKFIFSDSLTLIDNLLVYLFGESNFIIVARKK